MLEAADHERNSFVTLTYNDEHVPTGYDLNPADLSRFLKRFRKSVYPDKIRYFGVGEYGETTKRPHYHLALFGYPACAKGTTRSNRNGYCCPVCERVQRDWSLGNIYSGGLEESSAAYIAGYVTKKLTTEGAPGLDGKHPEFARMSLRPGIGAGAAAEISDTLIKHRLDNAEHLPTSLRHGKLKYPVGRYIREKTRQQTGISKEELQAFLDENSDPKVRALREAAFANAPPGSKAFAFKQALIDSAQGRITQIEQKHRAKRKEIL